MPGVRRERGEREVITPGKGHTQDDVIQLLRLMLDRCERPRHDERRCGFSGCYGCDYDRFEATLRAPKEDAK